MPRFGAVVAALGLLVVGAARAGDADLSWSGNVVAALKQASAAGKPALMDVGAVWCVPCKEMDEKTFPDPAVRSLADGFVLVKVDADVQATVIERYDVTVFPTLLFLDGKGGEIGRVKGFVAAGELASAMKAVRDGYARYLAYRPGKDDAEFLGDYLAAARNPRGAVRAYKRALKERAQDAERLAACEMKLASAERAAGDDRDAAALYERLSNEAADRTLRGQALRALMETQVAMGKRKDAEATYARLSKEFPELASEAGEPGGESD